MRKNKNVETVEQEFTTAIMPLPKAAAVDLDQVKVSQETLLLIPENIAIANKMLPLYLINDGTVLVVAMADPDNAVKAVQGESVGTLIDNVK